MSSVVIEFPELSVCNAKKKYLMLFYSQGDLILLNTALHPNSVIMIAFRVCLVGDSGHHVCGQGVQIKHSAALAPEHGCCI